MCIMRLSVALTAPMHKYHYTHSLLGTTTHLLCPAHPPPTAILRCTGRLLLHRNRRRQSAFQKTYRFFFCVCSARESPVPAFSDQVRLIKAPLPSASSQSTTIAHIQTGNAAAHRRSVGHISTDLNRRGSQHHHQQQHGQGGAAAGGGVERGGEGVQRGGRWHVGQGKHPGRSGGLRSAGRVCGRRRLDQ